MHASQNYLIKQLLNIVSLHIQTVYSAYIYAEQQLADEHGQCCKNFNLMVGTTDFST